MIHFSFPSVEDRHRWIEEGIATYVEPIARASVRILSAGQVWGEMARANRRLSLERNIQGQQRYVY
jgi:hypothetical protein